MCIYYRLDHEKTDFKEEVEVSIWDFSFFFRVKYLHLYEIYEKQKKLCEIVIATDCKKNKEKEKNI